MNITATLIGQSLAFLAFVIFCMKYVWPALHGLMQAREQRIANGLQQAELASKDLELAKQGAAEQMQAAKEQAQQLVEQANRRASQIVEDAKAQADTEAERIRQAAQAEVEREVARAREQLRERVAGLAMIGAEKVLKTSIDMSAHSRMLDELAAEL